jgi:Rrf2 family protein
VRLELSRRGDYAVRAAIAIAQLEGGQPVSARRIAERMSIPAGFLAHVLTDLVRAGIVLGVPGRSGGYRLAAPASEIDLLRIVDAVEERGEPARCVLRGGPCRVDGTCAVHDVFFAATTAMRRELASANLADVAAEGLARAPEPAIGTSDPA